MDDNELLEEATSRFGVCESHYSENYSDGEEDQRFVLGINQWDEDAKRARDIDGQPSLVLNQLLPYAHQIINDIRQTRPSIRVTPVDSGADVDTAEVLAGLIRNIERQSKANDAYDMAADNAIRAGLGWIRVTVDYEHEMSFNQEIGIERVLNFDSVYLDPNSQRLDGSDANYAFIFEDIEKEEFKRLYPDADTDGFEKGSQWQTEDTIRIAEYYYKVREKKNIFLCRYEKEGKEIQGVLLQEEIDALEEVGIVVEVLQKRETEFTSVKQCLLSGKEILEKNDWAGKYLPIVPVVGEECVIDGKREFHSLIRQAKDAQRMYNYWKSCSTSMIALQPKTPWIAPVGSFATYPQHWSNANKKNLPFLEYDIVYDDNDQRVEPPTRAPPIQGSPAMMQEAMEAREDIRLGLGIPLSNMGEAASEISGLAVRNRQIAGANATFHFVDNLATAITQVGVVIVDLIPKIYVGEQIKRIIGKDGKEKNVPLNQPYIKQEGGDLAPADGAKYDGIYDIAVGKYDVVVDVGASYSSQRQETADKITELLAARPELMEVVGDILFKSMDLPYSEEIAERIAAQMNPLFFADDPNVARLQAAQQQMEQMQEQIVNLDAALQDKAKNAGFEQTVELQKLELEKQKLAIDAEKTQADIAKIMSEIRNTNVDSAAEMTKIAEQIEDLAGALDIVMDNVQPAGEINPVETGVIQVSVEPEQSTQLNEQEM